VDFAYALHTDLGHRCRGAKVNGAIVPLDYKLKNGERVEIVAAKTGGPSRDWLNPSLELIASSRARNKVRQWFNSLELEQLIASGRALVERELQRGGKKDLALDELARHFGHEHAEDLFVAVAREEISPRQLQAALRGEEALEKSEIPDEAPLRRSRAVATGGILIVGVDRLLTQLARCCKPAPPDAIAGFVTRGRGVSIHRRNCASLARLNARYPERIISAEWGDQVGKVFPADIMVRANDRQGLLRDISEALSREKINVTAVKTQTRSGVASMSFTVEVGDIDHLRRALAAIEDVRGVMAASRR
jgi:GTP pyrophosphokinase